MKTINSIKSLSRCIESFKRDGKTIGLVATMGALHEGNFSNIKKSKKECDITVVSIFLNRFQSLKSEEINIFTGSLNKDKKNIEDLDVDILFLPKEESIYPNGYSTSVNIYSLSKILCGVTNPTYFESFTTLMCKLLNIVLPNTLYCSEKQYQEYIILKYLIKDLNLNLSIKTTKIVRNSLNIASSYKNILLSKREILDAPIIYKSLKVAKEHFTEGLTSSKSIINVIKEILSQAVTLKVDYISIVDSETLSELQTATKHSHILIACYCGKNRLTDNISLK